MGIFKNYDNPNIKEREQWEEYFSMILENKDLYEKVLALCNVELLEQLIPLPSYCERYNCTCNIDGMVFAEDGCGGCYTLLEDGDIARIDYAEGECGRVAETLRDLLELELNCAYAWLNYMRKEYIDNPSLLEKDVIKFEEEGRNDFEDVYGDDMPEYNKLQKEVAERLHLNIYNEIDKNVLPKLYKMATKQPNFSVKDMTNNEFFHELIY